LIASSVLVSERFAVAMISPWRLVSLQHRHFAVVLDRSPPASSREQPDDSADDHGDTPSERHGQHHDPSNTALRKHIEGHLSLTLGNISGDAVFPYLLQLFRQKPSTPPNGRNARTE
jgi:hypothetical protein